MRPFARQVWSSSLIPSLLASTLVACERDPRASERLVATAIQLTRDTLIINGPAGAAVPALLVDDEGRALPSPSWSVTTTKDSVVSSREGRLTCVGSGDASVTVVAAGLSRSLLVRCRPVVSFGFPPPLDLTLGGPPQPIRVNALTASGAAESLLGYSSSVRDTSIAVVRNGLVHPVAVGRTSVVVDFGGISTAVTATVSESIVADTLRLTPGEFRSWPLGAGRYEITVAPARRGASLIALAMETEGARCVRDTQTAERIHCSVRERGGVGVRNQSSIDGGATVHAVVRVSRVP